MTDLDRTFTAPPAGATVNGRPDAPMKEGRIAEALTRYDSAVQADPQCAPTHLNRGNVLLAIGRLDEARSAYQLDVVSHHPSNPRAKRRR